MTNEINGDHMLSGVDRRLWSLQQEIIYRWHTYCIFKHSTVHVPLKQPEFITFFVPRDSTYCYEIMEYLEKELGDMRSEPREAKFDDGSDHWPGTKVHIQVAKFSGIEPHLDREITDAMAKEFMIILKQMMKKRKTKDGKKEKEGEDQKRE